MPDNAGIEVATSKSNQNRDSQASSFVIVSSVAIKKLQERRKGHMKDALALGGEEGRDKLR